MKTPHAKFKCTADTFQPVDFSEVRWLDWEADFAAAATMWSPEFPLTREVWDEARTLDYRYCAIFKNNRAVGHGSQQAQS